MNPNNGKVNEVAAKLDALKSGIAKWNRDQGHPLNPAELRYLSESFRPHYTNDTLKEGEDIDPSLYLLPPGAAAMESHTANKPY
jgi:hypothetical protein